MKVEDRGIVLHQVKRCSKCAQNVPASNFHKLEGGYIENQ